MHCAEKISARVRFACIQVKVLSYIDCCAKTSYNCRVYYNTTAVCDRRPVDEARFVIVIIIIIAKTVQVAVGWLSDGTALR